MYSKNKVIKNVILVVGILALMLVLVFALGDIRAIFDTLINYARPWWILAALGVLFLYYFFNQLSIVLLTKRKYKNIAFIDLFCIAGSEYFFNGITPFSSGGQPFQVYALKQKEVRISDSTSILLLNFLAYQVVMNTISLFSVIFFYRDLSRDVENLSLLIIIGFGINFLVMVFLILLGSTKFMGRLIIRIIDMLSRIPFLKKLLGGKKEQFAVYVEDMQSAFREMGRSKMLWLACALSKVLSLLCYYSIPYFSFLVIGIGMGWNNIFYIIAMTSFALTLTAWVPTPGASGGAELAFTTIFVRLRALNSGVRNPDGNFETAKNLALCGMLIWRAFTYYFSMIFGLIMYVIFDRRARKSSAGYAEQHPDDVQ